MKHLTRMAVDRPVTIIMIILGFVLMGARGYSALTVSRYPNVSIPVVSVVVTWTGAAPQDLEQNVTKPIENAVSGVSGVDTIQSTDSLGIAVTTIRFLQNVDSNQAANDVERAVGRAQSQLPTGASIPTVRKADLQAIPILNVALSGPQSPADLNYSATNDLAPRLQAVPGVAAVNVSGGEVAQVEVQADPAKMNAYGISFAQLQTVLSAANVDTPAGAITTGPNRLAVRALGRFGSLPDIANLIVTSTPSLVRVQDLATVVETHKEIVQLQRLNGQQTVDLSITQAADANELQVADGVRQAIANMGNIIPQGAKLTIVTDNSQYTRSSVNSVETDLLRAVLITGLVLLLFLHTLRSTLIVLLAVPTSLITTGLFMFAMGFSLDTLSLMALALTIGILVDDSIVVLENITRHLRGGEKPKDAAINGRAEIGMAALAITLTDVVVYVPVAFMSGIIGEFFREYGLTIAAATLLSLFVSFTLTPMLASRWFSSNQERMTGLWGRFSNLWERGFTGLQNAYAGVLSRSLRRRPLIIFIASMALVAALAFIPLRLLGIEYMPSEDDNQFSINIRLPAGSSLAATDAVVQRLEAILKTEPEVTDVLSTIGSGTGGFGGSTGTAGGQMTVNLKPKLQRQRSVFAVLADVRRQAQSIKGANIQYTVQSFIGNGFQAALNVIVVGPAGAPDETTLIALSQQVANVVGSVQGVTDVRNLDSAQAPEWQAQLDPVRMNDLGINSTEAGNSLQTGLAGTLVGTLQQTGQVEQDITLIGTPQAQQDPTLLNVLPLKYTSTGTPITMNQIGEVVQGTAPGQILHYDRERSLTVSASVQGRSAGQVAADVQTALRQVQFPQDYGYVMAGQSQQQSDAFGAMAAALALSVVLIYMLMAALYESLLRPLAIMFSLPVSLVGAFGGLFLTGNTLNTFSILGIIMLMGLVTKNAILLVDFTDILRKRGYTRTEALVEAGRLRLRPILMTTSTVVMAMIPFLLTSEPGAESRAPLAAAVIGGLISSTLLTLVLVPTAYTYLDSLEQYLLRATRGRRVPRLEPQPMPQGVRPCEPYPECTLAQGK
jgi:hydrophobic/amphiphilic exporter-1 (mainly G- bacteria), HAE1 family